MNLGGALEELERYECFGVPAHAWTPAAELAAILMPARPAARALPADTDYLGMEAIPSPAFADFTLRA